MRIISFSDVITNSSSEVFVLHPKPEVNKEDLLYEIEEMLNTLCELTGEDPNEMYSIGSAGCTTINEDWWYYQEEGDIIIESISDNTIPGWMMDFIEEIYSMPKFEDKFSGYYAEDLGKKPIPHDVWISGEGSKITDEPMEVKSIQRIHLG